MYVLDSNKLSRFKALNGIEIQYLGKCAGNNLISVVWYSQNNCI